MTTVAIREKVVSYLQTAEEKKIKAIYALLQDDIEPKGRIDVKQYNKELADAEVEFAKGDFISHVAMKKKIRQWTKTK
jgi:hypothetical protein